jgi:hypothetical protein
MENTIEEQIKAELALHGITVNEINLPDANAPDILEALRTVPAPTTTTDKPAEPDTPAQ